MRIDLGLNIYAFSKYPPPLICWLHLIRSRRTVHNHNRQPVCYVPHVFPPFLL
jgi:hypothetical protein